MTKKLMSLAEGKVVLVLEGGYDLQSICDSAEMCVSALMNKQAPSFSSRTLNALPNSTAIQDLENVIDSQSKWSMQRKCIQTNNSEHTDFLKKLIDFDKL